MRTYTEAVTEEYTWITETMQNIWNQAFDANAIYDPEVVYLHDLAVTFHKELKVGEEYADNFFRIMEELKGVLGDLGRAIRGEKLPDHIQQMVQEERQGFGFRY